MAVGKVCGLCLGVVKAMESARVRARRRTK